eukprot:Gb_16470 [translate_table: standard]
MKRRHPPQRDTPIGAQRRGVEIDAHVLGCDRKTFSALSEPVLGPAEKGEGLGKVGSLSLRANQTLNSFFSAERKWRAFEVELCEPNEMQPRNQLRPTALHRLNRYHLHRIAPEPSLNGLNVPLLCFFSSFDNV